VNRGLMANKKRNFIIAVAIPVLILLGMMIKPAATVVYGQEILLETKAVDPTDLFRGDYVYLNFKIADVPKSKVSVPVDQEDVYVSLKPEGKYYVVDSVSLDEPEQGIYLKGRVYGLDPGSEVYYVDYSLDKYFVEQGTGKDLETGSQRGKLVGTVKVLNGYGVLTEVVEGE